MRLREVVTEPVDLSGLNAREEREVSLVLGAGTVRMEKQEAIKVVLHIAPEPIEGADLVPGPGGLEES